MVLSGFFFYLWPAFLYEYSTVRRPLARLFLDEGRDSYDKYSIKLSNSRFRKEN